MALKVLRPEFAGRADAETRFRREATTAARLRHPNIVTVRDVGSIDGVVYVAMDLLPLSLARRLDILARLPESDVVRVALDVASALSIAHAEGVVHRDIKPDNVLLTSTGDAVVADFGLALALSGDPSQSEANQVLGTPHYFSPEQARSQSVDGRTDLYSLGVTMYRAATGRLPFEGDDWYAVARQHIEGKVTPMREFVPDLSAEFDAVVMRLLAKRPEERFETATQLVDALLVLPSAPQRRAIGTPVTGGDATQVRTQLQSNQARSRRKRVLVGFLLLLFAAAGVAGIKWSMAVDQADRARRQSLADSLDRVRADSVAVAQKDSAVRDSVERARVATQYQLDSAQRADSQKTTPLITPRTIARKARIEIVAPDSAQLYLDDLPVGLGAYAGELVAGKALRVRASVPTSVVPCPSASRDSVVSVRAGETKKVHLVVASCGVLRLSIDPPESSFTLISVDVPFDTVSKPYPGQPIALVLRRGKYRLSVLSRGVRCFQYSDSVVVAPRIPEASDTVTRSVKLVCN